ncbi:MAG: NFACT family protein, partial [Thaumarchaeota archaeon]|nr:NFACT family protein [Nitrososphaerota archaeon]
MSSRASARSIDISGLEVAALVREISAQLGGSYLSNIYSAGDAQLLTFGRRDQLGGSYLSNIYSAGDAQLLTFGRRDEEKRLVISPRLGSWLTKRLAQRSNTTKFTTSLRGELLRSKLDSVSQLDMDRVFLFAFSHGTNKKELVLELMPPGNIILLDERRKTIVALRDVRSTQRKVSRGVVYSPPAQARLSPDRVDQETLKSMLAKGGSVGRALGKGISLPRRYIDEILRRSGLRQDDPSLQNDEKVGEVAGAVKAIIEETADPHPCVVKLNDETHLMAIRPTTGEVLREGATLSELLDETVRTVVTEAEVHEETSSERREEEYRVTLSRLNVQLGQLEENSNRLRERANLIRSRTSAQGVVV